MDQHIGLKDWLFLCVCLGLGILAEMSFLHGEIGVSYMIFIIGFYIVIFLKFRLSFNHRRIGLLFMVAIWILSGSYLLYDNTFFYSLNLVIIPILVLSHVVLITSPNTFQWDTPKFVLLLIMKLQMGKQYLSLFFNHMFKSLFKGMGEQTTKVVKKVLVGLSIGVPLLFVITGLLMSADEVFQKVILHFPKLIFQINILEMFFRLSFIVLVGLLLFGIFQILLTPAKREGHLYAQEKKLIHFDGITAITILILLNGVYLLFVAVQFKYFFSDVLIDGFTYAEYARRGFAELLFVILINWTILMSFLKLVRNDHPKVKVTINILYSLLVAVSGVMLASSYQRLSMYEAAYGFTLGRLLAHAFMIFLMIIFAYTLIRVWIDRLSVTHFYLIMGLIFYTILNVVHVDQMIVNQNIERYKQTGKIDIDYLYSLSSTGLDGLIQLYEIDPEYPELDHMLLRKKEWMKENQMFTWQSFNFTRQKVVNKLSEQTIKEGSK